VKDRAGSGQADDTGEIRRVLSSSADAIVAELHHATEGGLTLRERELAAAVAGAVVRRLPGLLANRPDNIRLAELETWRKDADAWRLKLTGADDRNGRIGRQDQALAELRRDVGTREARELERAAAATVTGVRRKLIAAAGSAVVALVAAGWALYRSDRAARDIAAAGAARIETRLEAHEKTFDRLFQFLGAPRPDPTRTP
jgi:hypothetical protein